MKFWKEELDSENGYWNLEAIPCCALDVMILWLNIFARWSNLDLYLNIENKSIYF